jgi:hypothetical protein
MNLRNVIIVLLLAAAYGRSAPTSQRAGMEDAFNGLVRDLVEEAFEGVRNLHIEGDLAGLLLPTLRQELLDAGWSLTHETPGTMQMPTVIIVTYHFAPPGRDDAPCCVFRAGFEYGPLAANGWLYELRETDDGVVLVKVGYWAS